MAVVLILRRPGLTGGREFTRSCAEDGVTRVCVAGAGVIGSLFAAHLSRVAEVSRARAPRGARARR